MIVGNLRFKHGEDEQLVPEDVPAIRLAVQSAGRHPDVEILAVVGDGLQQMEQMQSQDAQFVCVVFEFDRQPFPDVRPGNRVRITYLGESPLTAKPTLGPRSGLRRRDVAPGDQGDDLVHGQRPAFREICVDLMTDLELLVDEPVLGDRRCLLVPYGGPCGHRDRNLRLPCPDGQQHRILRQLRLFR